MYSNAELFIMASNPRAVKEIFLNNVTLSAEDGASGCIDLDGAELVCRKPGLPGIRPLFVG